MSCLPVLLMTITVITFSVVRWECFSRILIPVNWLSVPVRQHSAECAASNWSTEEAQKRMENVLAAYYQNGTKLDAVLASNDSVANGVTNALVASYKGEMPIITGQDCDITSVKNIIAGKQSMSIFKDTRQLASKLVEMVTAIVEGKEVPVNDTKSYDNGKGIVPTYLCTPVFADQDNYKEVLIDSGYYSEKDVK